ncbi:MAG: calcium-binding protein [Pseudomonadota bacterium]
MAIIFNTEDGTADDDFVFGHPAQGSGDNTLNGLDGDDLIYGDFNFFFSTVTTTPRVIDNVGVWSRAEQTDIANDSIPHTSVLQTAVPTATNEQAYVFNQLNAQSQLLILDIDYGTSAVGTNGLFGLRLFDEDDNIVTPFVDENTTDVGSTVEEPFQQYLLPMGIYRIVVSGPNGTPLTTGSSYMLHVSLTNKDVSTTSPLLGPDTINGGLGRDIIYGQDGDDILIGGPSDIDDGPDTIYGGSGNDQITGGFFVDTVFGGDGNDTFFFNSNDFFDEVDGGTGIDTLDFSGYGVSVQVNLATGQNGRNGNINEFNLAIRGIESMIGSHFGDFLVGLGTDNNLLVGNGGDDTLLGLGGNDGLVGGAGNDDLFGGAGADVMNGGGGQDMAHYSGANSRVVVDLQANGANTGDAAGDILISIEDLAGSRFGDALLGNGFANTLFGEDGNDQLYGRGGSDIFFGGAGGDLMNGGTGADTVNYSASSSGVTVDLLNNRGNGGAALGDWLISIEGLVGTAFSDTLLGTNGVDILSGLESRDFLIGRGGNDILFGGDGNDVLVGGPGGDQLFGGDGVDVVSYFDAGLRAIADLVGQSNNAGAAGGDRYANVESLIGTRFNDALLGDAGSNGLTGLAGNDALYGRAGNDFLNGGPGADFLFGGPGIDTAVYFDATQGVGINLRSAQQQTLGGAAGDVLDSIENLTGSNFADVLVGGPVVGAQPYTIRGNGGDDIIFSPGSTQSTASAELFGDAGNDTFIAGLASEMFFGGDGIDTLNFREMPSFVQVFGTRLGGGVLGGLNNDSFDSIEQFIGTQFNDQFFGSATIMRGRGGNDMIFGFGGISEVLDGGPGNDRLGGGDLFLDPDFDVLIFRPGEGNDTVQNFGDNLDTLRLIGFGFGNVNGALAQATNTVDGVFFDFGPNSTILIENMTVAQIANDIELF